MIIVEDEQHAAKRLERMLLDLNPDIRIKHVFETIAETTEFLDQNPQPDVLFLDIHLADGNSFEIFNLVAVKSKVVFTTAYDAYAVKAFRANAIDYLLKPVKENELSDALKKVKESQKTGVLNLESLLKDYKPESPKRLLSKLGSKLYAIDHRDIAYFFTKDKISFAMTVEGLRLPVNKTLDQLEESVDPVMFFRGNRQVILSNQGIKEMHAYSKSRVKVVLHPPLDMEVIISTEKTSLFKDWLKGEE